MAKAPLSTHPAFPFIVGLWFAALLGIGSLVVPVPVIERLVEMTGLAVIVPQAAPPLGLTARALIALTCALGGGLAGLLVARKLGQAHRGQGARKDRGQLAARRPISAHDELGAEGLDGPDSPETSRGRRALAIVDEEIPSEVLELAPLPGKALPLSALDLAEVEALELADAEMIHEQAVVPGKVPEDGPIPGFSTLHEDVAYEDFADDAFSMAERRHFKLDTFGQTVGAPIRPRQQFIIDPAPVSDMGQPETGFEPEPEADLHFSPPSLARPAAEPEIQPDLGPDDMQEAEMDRFAAPASLDPVPSASSAAAPAADWQDGELEDLALVQLAQRLGSSIARRREQRAAAAAAAAAASARTAGMSAAPTMLAEGFDAAEAVEAAQAMAAYFGSVPAGAPTSHLAEPAADYCEPVIAPPAAPGPAAATPPADRQVFRPMELAPVPQPASLANLARIDLDEDEEDEDDHIASLTASFSLPLARPAPAAAMTHFEAMDLVDAEEADEAEVTLAPVSGPAPSAAPFAPPFANPFQQRPDQFVRIENEPEPEDGTIEPAVVFPGAARADTAAATSRASAEDNERALREALMGLQRMSGTA